MMEQRQFTEETWPTRWPNFSYYEMRCQETGDCQLNPEFMDRLQALRNEYGRGMRITSGYRSSQHSIEAAKEQPGAHSTGSAVDVSVTSGDMAYELTKLAFEHDMYGIGLALKGGAKFVHMDGVEPKSTHLFRPALWIY
jgi:zinc D-Ala-D-Ala carboxypeptidase